MPSAISLDRVAADLATSPLQRDAQVVGTAEVTVRNTGDTDGDEVLMLFASPPSSGLGGAPLRHLVDFKRVHVAAGQSVSAAFELRTLHLSYADAEGERVTRKGEWRFWVGVRGEGAAAEVLTLG